MNARVLGDDATNDGAVLRLATAGLTPRSCLCPKYMSQSVQRTLKMRFAEDATNMTA